MIDQRSPAEAPADKFRILIVDDDVELGSMLVRLLTMEGLTVEFQPDSRAALDRHSEGLFDLLILDVMMPPPDGFEILRRVRESGETPVLMLTARGDEEDRVRGLDLGADDYLAKPFGGRELVARVKAILRRSPANKPEAGPLFLGPLAIDPSTMCARFDGIRIALTAAEFRVLDLLARSPGQVQSRDHLCRRALGRPLEAFDRSIDTHVSCIRRKLHLTPAGPIDIKSARGHGYMMTFTGTRA
jgi:two-component system response regulator CpxR